jgi:hypothetical protein
VTFPRFRVVSDSGVATGTKIIDLVTGQAIPNVNKIVLTAEVNNAWKAEVHLVGVAVDVSVFEDELTRRFAPLPQATD